MVPALIKEVTLGQCDGTPLTWPRVNVANVWMGALPPAWHLCVSKQLSYVSVDIQFSFPCFQHKYQTFSASCNWEKWCAPCSLFSVPNAYISFLFSLQTIQIFSMALTLLASGMLFVWNLKLKFVQREQRVLKISIESHLWLRKPSFGTQNTG